MRFVTECPRSRVPHISLCVVGPPQMTIPFRPGHQMLALYARALDRIRRPRSRSAGPYRRRPAAVPSSTLADTRSARRFDRACGDPSAQFRVSPPAPHRRQLWHQAGPCRKRAPLASDRHFAALRPGGRARRFRRLELWRSIFAMNGGQCRCGSSGRRLQRMPPLRAGRAGAGARQCRRDRARAYATMLPADSLRCAHLNGHTRSDRPRGGPDRRTRSGAPDLSTAAERRARRALEVAAAGGHSCCCSGPPGAGKSMLAQRHARRAAGDGRDGAIRAAAVASIEGRSIRRASTASRSARRTTQPRRHLLVGGGAFRARTISLTSRHHGVCSLDELPSSTAACSVPARAIETGTVTVSRARRRAEFPARFQLVAAMNPVPCGHLGTCAKSLRRCRIRSRVTAVGCPAPCSTASTSPSRVPAIAPGHCSRVRRASPAAVRAGGRRACAAGGRARGCPNARLLAGG